MSSFIEWKDMKIVYKRYASLYFCTAIDVRPSDNPNLYLLRDTCDIFRPKTMS